MLGLLIGAATLPAMALAGIAVTSIAQWLSTGIAAPPASLFNLGLAVVAYGTIVSGLGLLLIAVPIWAVLHALGQRGPVAALVLGLTASFTVAFWKFISSALLFTSWSDNGGPLVADHELTVHGWLTAATSAGWVSLAGAGAGFVVWRIAYRRSELKDA